MYVSRSVRLGESDLECLQEIAEETGLTASQLVRIAVRRFSDEYNEGGELREALDKIKS